MTALHGPSVFYIDTNDLYPGRWWVFDASQSSPNAAMLHAFVTGPHTTLSDAEASLEYQQVAEATRRAVLPANCLPDLAGWCTTNCAGPCGLTGLDEPTRAETLRVHHRWTAGAGQTRNRSLTRRPPVQPARYESAPIRT